MMVVWLNNASRNRMLAGRVPSGRGVTGRFASSPFAFADGVA